MIASLFLSACTSMFPVPKPEELDWEYPNLSATEGCPDLSGRYVSPKNWLLHMDFLGKDRRDGDFLSHKKDIYFSIDSFKGGHKIVATDGINFIDRNILYNSEKINIFN